MRRAFGSQALQPGQFIVLLGCVARAALASLAHIQRARAAVEEVLKGVCGGRSLVAPAAADFAEVAQAVSEAVHGRWIKLLAARWTSPLLRKRATVACGNKNQYTRCIDAQVISCGRPGAWRSEDLLGCKPEICRRYACCGMQACVGLAERLPGTRGLLI